MSYRIGSLNYNYYRDYDTLSGRYLESDPIGLDGGPNTYLYAAGNPLKWVDPYGLAPGDIFSDPYSAAADAFCFYYQDSVDNNIEWAGYVYEVAEGGYSYSEGITDNKPGSVDISRFFRGAVMKKILWIEYVTSLVPRAGIAIHEDRRGAHVEYAVGWHDMAKCRHDHFIARPDAQGQHRQMHPAGS